MSAVSAKNPGFPSNNNNSRAANISSSLGNNGMRSLVSGAGAGVLTTLVCCPLDVAKVRVQVQGSLGVLKYIGAMGALRTIFVEEGVRGLFKGLAPALMTVPLFWGIYFHSYDYFKGKLSENHVFFSSNPTLTLVVAAVGAGAIGDIVTNPLWVTRTRIQTYALHEVVERTLACRTFPTVVRPTSTWEIMRTIYREEGLLAFYKGLGASFLGLTHVAIQFPLYEHIKKYARENRESGVESATDLAVASITAKFVASMITYPHEVVRSRLQDSRRNHMHIQHVVQEVVVEEGFWALWSGLSLNLLRVVPSTICTFLANEYISRYLKN